MSESCGIFIIYWLIILTWNIFSSHLHMRVEGEFRNCFKSLIKYSNTNYFWESRSFSISAKSSKLAHGFSLKYNYMLYFFIMKYFKCAELYGK